MCSISGCGAVRAVAYSLPRTSARSAPRLACVVMWSNYFHSIDKINSALKSAVFTRSRRSVASLILVPHKSPRFLADKKKAHVIGFLVPFYVKHSKGFVSALCDQSK